jgi:hypothetical protein
MDNPTQPVCASCAPVCDYTLADIPIQRQLASREEVFEAAKAHELSLPSALLVHACAYEGEAESLAAELCDGGCTTCRSRIEQEIPKAPAGSRETVYFISSEGQQELVKIGFTAGSAQERLKALQIGSPVPLQLLHCVETSPGEAQGLEGEFHNRWAELRVHGEWFKVAGDLAEFLALAKLRGPVEALSGPSHLDVARNGEQLLLLG